MSRLSDALRAFSKVYHEAAPVSQGDCHDESSKEIDVWPLRRDPKNTVSASGYRILDAEGDSRRGAASDGYPVDKSQPEDAMSPGWNGPGDDDDDALKDASAGRSRVKIRCPHCSEKNTVRLPRHLTLARMDETRTGEARTSEGKVLRTKCGKCAEDVRFHAPEGYSFQAKTSEAARHFAARYRYLTGRGGSITRGIRSAREAFRKSYWGR